MFLVLDIVGFFSVQDLINSYPGQSSSEKNKIGIGVAAMIFATFSM